MINYNLNAFYDCSFERVFYEGTVVDWCKTSFAIDDFNSCKSNPMLLSKENFFLDQDGDWYQPKELVIPDTVSEIKDYQFASLKNLKTIVISDSVTRIGFAAFKNCSALEELTIPFVGESSDSVFNGYFGYIFGANKYIDNQIYVPSTLKELSITNATMIDTGAFKGCTKIETISISDTVTTIKNYAFEACSSLTSIRLPNSLLNIGEGAFKYCDSLQYLIMPTNVKTIKKTIFEGILSTPLIYYLGTLDQWNQIEISENNDQIVTNSNIPTVYFYSKDYPINTGFYWKFDDNNKPIKWTR